MPSAAATSSSTGGTATPSRVLAVYAHPDDPEVSCAGTLALWADAGAEVHLIICAQGDKGSADPATDPATLAERRAAETEAAAAVLGLASVVNLGYLDGEVANDPGLRAELVRRIRLLAPDVVVAPDPTAVFFGATYVNHRDHRELGFAVLDAVAPAAASPLYFPDAGDAHRVGSLYLSGTLEPDTFIDVSAALDRKVAALLCHASQIADPGEVEAMVHRRVAQAGATVGVGAAEAFRVIHPR